MAHTAVIRRLSVAEYLDGELRAEVKHEYVAGEVFAMVGASKNHNRITRNLVRALDTHLAGGPCEVFFTDVKVRVEPADAFYYPDLAVACDPRDDDEFYVTRPLLVIEVPSPTTEGIDRREKRLNYQKLDSLAEFVLVAQDSRRVEIYRRTAGDEWAVEVVTDAQSVARFASIDLILPMTAIYDGVVPA